MYVPSLYGQPSSPLKTTIHVRKQKLLHGDKIACNFEQVSRQFTHVLDTAFLEPGSFVLRACHLDSIRPGVMSVHTGTERNQPSVWCLRHRSSTVLVSGVSGSGKSTLAYDTIFQEGQRKYLESLSAYARQFIKSLAGPEVRSIKGIAPTIAIDQKHSSYYFNSTVGTISEIAPYLRLLFAKLAEARCPQCGRQISRYSGARIGETIFGRFPGNWHVIFSPLVRNRRGNYQALFEKYRKRGFLKALVNGRVYDLDERCRPWTAIAATTSPCRSMPWRSKPATASASTTASPWP